jgi:apolipoprotein N-acyltransferase
MGGDVSMIRTGLASLSGLLLVASFPPFDLDGLAWIALVPLFLAIDGATPPRAGALAALTGLIFFVGVFAWIWQVPAYNVLDEALLGTYLALYLAVWACGLRWLRGAAALPAALLAPALWVALEYVRSHAGFLALPWMLLGHSQYRHPALLQLTSITGVFGLSFVIVLVNAALADVLRRRPGTWRALPGSAPAAAGLLAVVLVHGAVVLSGEAPAERLAVAAVQGNVPQNVKWDAAFKEATLQRYAELTREAARGRPAVIVWPETAVPGDVEHDPRLFRPVRDLARETGLPLLVGTSEHAKFTKREYGTRAFNSMMLVTPEGRIADIYRKIRLVPFGEYPPLERLVTWPAAIASSMGNSVAGERLTVFRINGVPIASTICWENIFPELFRRFVREGARVVVNATNEAWFQDSGAPRQFLAISVFRAAENRVAVLRVANTGISAFIDPHGRIVERLRGSDGRDVFVAGVLVASMPVTRTETVYTVYGDVFAVSLLAASALLTIGVSLRRLAWRLRVTHQAPSPLEKLL